MLLIFQIVVTVENIILRRCREAKIAERSEDLGAMVGAVVDHMEEHLPQGQIFIFSIQRFFKQHIIS